MLPQAPLRLTIMAFVGTGLAACMDMESGQSSGNPAPVGVSTSGSGGIPGASGSASGGSMAQAGSGTSGGGSGGSGNATGGSSAGMAGANATAGAGGTSGTAGAGSAGSPSAFPFVDPVGENCDGKNIRLGEMQIFPNEWNDPRAETCVFLKNDGSFGWRWVNGDFGAPVGPDMPLLKVNKDWPNYPELEFGINPWNASGLDQSTTTLLPKKLGDITEASMTVDITTDVSGGKWNLAFELWLSDKNPVENPGSKAVAEVMVFLSNDPGYWPTEPQTGDKINDGERDYLLYQTSDTWGEEKTQKYRQYRLAGGAKSFNGKLNIGKFLDHYKQEGWSKDLWLTRFEIGNEVYSNAKGTTTLKSISFSVNGESRAAKTAP